MTREELIEFVYGEIREHLPDVPESEARKLAVETAIAVPDADEEREAFMRAYRAGS